MKAMVNWFKSQLLCFIFVHRQLEVKNEKQIKNGSIIYPHWYRSLTVVDGVVTQVKGVVVDGYGQRSNQSAAS